MYPADAKQTPDQTDVYYAKIGAGMIGLLLLAAFLFWPRNHGGKNEQAMLSGAESSPSVTQASSTAAETGPTAVSSTILPEPEVRSSAKSDATNINPAPVENAERLDAGTRPTSNSPSEHTGEPGGAGGRLEPSSAAR